MSQTARRFLTIAILLGFGASFSWAAFPIDQPAIGSGRQAGVVDVLPGQLNPDSVAGATVLDSLSLWNGSGTSIDYSVTVAYFGVTGWITGAWDENGGTGSVSPGSASDLGVLFDPAGLTPGTHVGRIIIDVVAPAQTIVVKVYFSVSGGGLGS